MNNLQVVPTGTYIGTRLHRDGYLPHPHPLLLLQSPLTKEAGKKLVKSKVIDFWEKKLRQDCDELPSLIYFKSSFMSLTTPHPLWTTCEDNPFEISKAVVAAKFLSGRYPTDRLLRHFDKNLTGRCTLCPDDDNDGSLEHLLLLCPSLTNCRQQQLQMLTNNPAISDKARDIILAASVNPIPHFVQLLLDCSVLPVVIVTRQEGDKNIQNEIFKFSRTWCFNVHMQRMKMLGRWTKC